jgi:Xaa-Pro dipeptidase
MTPNPAVTESRQARRQARLTGALPEHGLDALAVNAGPTLHYLTGLHFHLSERPVVGVFTPASPPLLVLPELEAGKLAGLAYDLQAITYGEDPASWGAAFGEAAKKSGINGRSVGVEPRVLRVLELRYLEAAAPGASWVDAADLVSSLRVQKDAEEIASMRQAAQIAQEAMRATLPSIRLGMTERELAGELSLQLLRAGSEPTLPFQPIAAFGPNSANPHAVPTGRALGPDELVLVDWGASHHGYFSDITRVFVSGEPDPAFRRMAEVVAAANAAGRARAAPGIPAGEVDRAARQVLEESEFGEWIRHRTGHGLGLEIHEEPFIRAGNPELLAPGMTFTVEPGLYRLGQGGVRFEDDVVITEDGAESLTDLPRELVPVAGGGS